MPELGQIWEIFHLLMAPAMGASLAVMLAVRRLGGKYLAPLATTLAVAAGAFAGGVWVGNLLSNDRPWQLSANQPWDGREIFAAFQGALEYRPLPSPPAEDDPDQKTEETTPAPPDEPPKPKSHVFWVPYVAALAMVAELLLTMLVIPAGPGWTVRTLVAFLAGRLLTPLPLRAVHFWMPWALGLAILLEWAVLVYLAKRWLDGTVAAGLAMCLAAAGLVIEHEAAFATSTHLALLMVAVLAGPALAAWIWPSDTGPSLAAAAVVLPGLLLVSRHETFDPSASPGEPFLSLPIMLVGLAPLAWLPLTIPYLTSRERWLRWLPGLALPLIPAILAVVLSMAKAPESTQETSVRGGQVAQYR